MQKTFFLFLSCLLILFLCVYTSVTILDSKISITEIKGLEAQPPCFSEDKKPVYIDKNNCDLSPKEIFTSQISIFREIVTP